MTIRKGESWGEEIELPSDVLVASSDAELARHASDGAELVRLTGGDLLRTLGSATSFDNNRAWAVSIDVGICSFGAEQIHFVAHVAAYSKRWAMPSTVVMNAEYFGSWDLAPRGHPNDGRFELVEMAIPRKDRRQFRNRVTLGNHLPHPAISIRKIKAWQAGQGGRLVIDGIDHGRVESFEISLIPDALLVAI